MRLPSINRGTFPLERRKIPTPICHQLIVNLSFLFLFSTTPKHREWIAVSRRSKALAKLPGPEYGKKKN